MATKRFKEQTNHYEIVVENKKYSVYLYEYTTYVYSSGNHVEHSCLEIYDSNTYETVADVMGRDSWCGRPWQRFDYDNSRQDAVLKSPKFLQNEIHKLIVEGKYKEVRERCERFSKAFEAGWNALSSDNKEKIANAVGSVETMEQAEATLGLVTLASIIQQ